MDLEAARGIASRLLAERFGEGATLLRDELTAHGRSDWMFFWGREAEVRPGRTLFGATPIIVDRASGSTRFISGAHPAQWIFDAYEAIGEHRFDAGEWKTVVREQRADDFRVAEEEMRLALDEPPFAELKAWADAFRSEVK